MGVNVADHVHALRVGMWGERHRRGVVGKMGQPTYDLRCPWLCLQRVCNEWWEPGSQRRAYEEVRLWMRHERDRNDRKAREGAEGRGGANRCCS